jgi:hypothetical protein
MSIKTKKYTVICAQPINGAACAVDDVVDLTAAQAKYLNGQVVVPLKEAATKKETTKVTSSNSGRKHRDRTA